MCEEDYGQLLEEYRGLVETLFTLVLDRLSITEEKLFNLKLDNERRKAEKDVQKALDEMNKFV